MLIDKIYVINLKKNIEKKNNILIEFDKLGGIFKDAYFFEAIVGKDLEEREINNLLTTKAQYTLNYGRREHSEVNTKGAIGCYMSHYYIWKDIIKNNYKNVLICEDDIYTDSGYEKIVECIDNIPEDYDIAYLGYFMHNLNPKYKKVNNYWNIIDEKIFGTYSYVLSNSGAKKLLSKSLPIEMQVDSYMSYFYFTNPDFKRYLSNDILFYQTWWVTDIQNDKCIICWYTDLSYFFYNNISLFSTILILIIILLTNKNRNF